MMLSVTILVWMTFEMEGDLMIDESIDLTHSENPLEWYDIV